MANELGISLWRKVPTDASSHFTEEQRARSRAFAQRRNRIDATSFALAAALVLVFVVGRAAHLVAGVVPGPWWTKALAVVATYSIIDMLVRLPVERARWALDSDKDATEQTLQERLRHHVSRLGALPLYCGFVVTVYWLVRSTPLWWAWTSALILGAMLAAITLRPLIGAGKREQFSSLDDERVRRRLVLLAREAGVHVGDALVLRDGSKRPSAFVAGFGRRSVLVLTDEALKMDPPAIDFLLGHELAHVRSRHQRDKFLLLALTLLVSVGLLAIALRSRLLIEGIAGLRSIRDPEAVILVDAGLGAALPLTTFLLYALSRFHERFADVEALSFTRDPAAGEQLFQHLGELGAPIESTGIDYLRSGHPPLAERIELLRRWRRTRQAAILFTDVVDSTATVSRMGDPAWVEMLHEHEAVVRHCVEALHGKVVKDTGDGFLAELPDVGAAVLCAIRIQRSIAERAETDPNGTVHARIGVHAGEVVRDRADMRGREVHFAARVAASAGSDQILVSEHVASALDDADRFTLGAARTVELKGLGPQSLHEVHWREEPVALEPIDAAATTS